MPLMMIVSVSSFWFCLTAGMWINPEKLEGLSFLLKRAQQFMFSHCCQNFKGLFKPPKPLHNRLSVKK